MAFINLSYQQAESINQTIDRFHEPYYWSIFGVFALLFALEIFLPEKRRFSSQFDRYFTYFRFSIIILITLVALSQGLAGGCVLQIPQNWLAQNYLGREYWYPYGLVFREHVPQQFWPLLHFTYFLASLITPYFAFQYYQKRIKKPNIGSRQKESQEGLKSRLVKHFLPIALIALFIKKTSK